MFRSTHRKFKPEPFWRDLIDRWKVSGQSVAAFCAAHRVSQATFYSWRKRVATRTRCMSSRHPAFTPVRVVSDPMAEVVLPNGLIVRVPAATEPTTVARLVATLWGCGVLTLGLTGRIWTCPQPQDGRKGIDGLAAVVTTYLGRLRTTIEKQQAHILHAVEPSPAIESPVGLDDSCEQLVHPSSCRSSLIL